MLKAVRGYLSFAGIQYRNPEKAGDEREKMLSLREKGQKARKAFTELAKTFQANHPEWQLQQTSQWMNQAQRLRPHFWVYLLGEGKITEPMLALRLYGNVSDFGISLEVSFIERKKDERTLDKQARVLEVPVVEGIYYLAYADGESQKIEATEVNRCALQEELSNREIRKVLVKSDVSVSRTASEEEIIQELHEAYHKLLPYYRATRE